MTVGRITDRCIKHMNGNVYEISDCEWLTHFNWTFFYQLLTGYNAQQTWPVSKPPFPPPLSRFFLIIYVARYVHFSSFRFWFRFGLTFFFLFFLFFAPQKIVKLYKKLVSIVFIDRASYSPHSPTQLQKGRQGRQSRQLPAPTGTPFARGLHFIGNVCVPRRMRNEDIKHIVKQQIKMSSLHNSNVLCVSLFLDVFLIVW